MDLGAAVGTQRSGPRREPCSTFLYSALPYYYLFCRFHDQLGPHLGDGEQPDGILPHAPSGIRNARRVRSGPRQPLTKLYAFMLKRRATSEPCVYA